MKQYKHKTALLIDDSYIDNLINRKILENYNFSEKIIVVNSGIQAIEFLRESVNSNKNFPIVIFLDIRMPVMNGFDFLKSLNSMPGLNPDNVTIYMLSSSLDPTDLKKVEENTLVSRFIGKPLTGEILDDIA